jgi:hypothetical protein
MEKLFSYISHNLFNKLIIGYVRPTIKNLHVSSTNLIVDLEERCREMYKRYTSNMHVSVCMYMMNVYANIF